MKRLSAMVIAVGFLLAACGSGGSSEPSAEEQQFASVQSYFNGLIGGNTDQMLNSSTPASPANQYATWRRDYLDSYEWDETQKVVQEESVEKVIVKWGDDTLTYTDLKFGDDNKVSTWTADPGGPLAPRINATSKNFKVKPLNGKVTSQYINTDGELSITLQLKNTTNKEIHVVPQNYVNPNGKQVSPSIRSGRSSGGFSEVAGNALANALIEVKRGEIGGTLSLYTTNKDGYRQQEVTVKLPK